MKNYVNVASKLISKNNKIFFVVILKVTDENIAGSGSVSQRYGSADPDPYRSVADLQN